MSDTENSKKIIEPSILSGFIELLPREQVAFNKMKDIIRDTYESYGFIPIDTPVLEKSEILLAKSGGETEKQIYRFQKGDTDMAMRFDLTVPLARFVAQHAGELAFPFKRYHIGKVYRGERPQKGRFREFYQCDIDIIGNGSLSINNDAEIVSVINSVFKKLDFGAFTIMINNRKVLNGFFESVGVTDKTEVMRIIDKIDKIGRENVAEELIKTGLSETNVEKILDFITIEGSAVEVVEKLKSLTMDNEEFKTGVTELEEVTKYIKAYNVEESSFAINLKIARGLDYYTGTVYETVLNDYPQLGSICSGGRYDNLASNYTKQSLPGVGISIGLSRLFYQLSAAGILKEADTSTTSKILLVPMDGTLEYTLKSASLLREAGINTEVYLNSGKMGKKFAYADKLGIKFVSVIGEDEIARNVLSIKDMKSGEQKDYSISEAVELLKN